MKTGFENPSDQELVADLTPLELERAIPGARHFSLWLVPSQNDYNLLAEIIRNLANQHNAPVFEPHVTIYTGAYTQKDNLKKLVVETVENVQPI